MSAKEQLPWKMLSARLSSNPVLHGKVYSLSSDELEDLSLRLKEATLSEVENFSL